VRRRSRNAARLRDKDHAVNARLGTPLIPSRPAAHFSPTTSARRKCRPASTFVAEPSAACGLAQKTPACVALENPKFFEVFSCEFGAPHSYNVHAYRYEAYTDLWQLTRSPVWPFRHPYIVHSARIRDRWAPLALRVACQRHNLAPTSLSVNTLATTRSSATAQRNSQEGELVAKNALCDKNPGDIIPARGGVSHAWSATTQFAPSMPLSKDTPCAARFLTLRSLTPDP
jgi:hypothetical protein